MARRLQDVPYSINIARIATPRTRSAPIPLETYAGSSVATALAAAEQGVAAAMTRLGMM
jgi:hypothetical protein